MTDPSASLKVRPDAARAMEEARHEAVSIRHALDTIELEEALEGRDVVKDFRRHAEVIEGLLRAFTQRDARLTDYWQLRVEHARKQGEADGFQDGWQAALKRVSEGDSVGELQRLVPKSQRDARLAAIVQEMRNRASDKWEIGEALRNDLLRWVDQLAALGADEEGK